jgi:hypothetical protein
MGLGFIGGFAGGMSASIERNRDRVDKEAAAAQKSKDTLNAQNVKIAGDIQEKRLNSEKVMSDLSSRKNKILSGETGMSQDQATKAVAAITGQMQSVVKGMSQYAVDLGKSPQDIIDASAYDLNGYKVVNGNLFVDTETEAMIKNSNGDMKIVDDTVHQKVKKTNSTGQPIDELDGNGEPIFEATPIKLRKTTQGDAIRPKGQRITPQTQTRMNDKGQSIYIDDAGNDILVDGKPVAKSIDKKKAKLDKTLVTTMKNAKRDNFLKVVGKLDTLVGDQGEGGWGFSGVLGAIAGFLPIGSERSKGEDFLKTIDATIAFDTLQSMRDASPTGGALGQVSERELDLLKSSIDAVNLEQEPEFIRGQLNDLREGYMKIVHGLEYNEETNDFVPIGEAGKTTAKKEVVKTKFNEVDLRAKAKASYPSITDAQLNRYIAREKKKLGRN